MPAKGQFANYEAALQRRVIELARSLGLLVFHSTDSRRDVGRGWVDLVILTTDGSGCLFVELKSAQGKLTDSQLQVKWSLIASGLSYRLWRPHNFDNGEIERELRLIA
jgi:hypothetical protein